VSLGKKEISVLLLAVGVLITFFVALKAVPSEAQANCPGARQVNKTTGNGNKQSPVFNITGTSLRLNVDSTATSQDPQFAALTAYVYPEGDTVDFAGNFSVDGGRDDSSIINAGPGRFYLDLNTANVDYTVTVEDCTGTASGDAQNNEPSTAEANGNQDRKGRVDPKTIPKNKKLPPTGGIPTYVITTGAILTGVGLLGLGFVIRQRPRR
jgi:hypothetical protein